MSSLVLLPAVDVAGGVAVWMVRGEPGTETRYGDPLDAAVAWQRDGAEWIHLVDLDAAFGVATITLSWRPSSGGWTSRSSCPGASATTPRSTQPSAPEPPA